MLNIKKIKKDFPVLAANKKLAYLDNAATAQMPKNAIKEVQRYCSKFRASTHSTAHKLGFETSEYYEEARRVVAGFINAKKEEIVFTPGTTYGLNMLAFTLGKTLKPGDNVVLTRMEHHSNLVPWIQMSKIYGFDLRFIELDKDYALDICSAEKMIDANTKIVAAVHVSNALGSVNPVEKIVSLARKAGALSIIDAAQSVPHMKVDVKRINCDFLVFSGHKVGGPSGIGVLYGKKEALENLDTFMVGGGMINEVSYNNAEWTAVPNRFEAGSVNTEGAIGLAQALQYLDKIGMDKIFHHEKELINYTLKKLKSIKRLKIIGPVNLKNRAGVISFVIEGIHPHDIAAILDKNNVAVRAGHHCTMPLMKLLGLSGTVRVSFWIYNDKKDVDNLIRGIKEALKIFKIR